MQPQPLNISATIATERKNEARKGNSRHVEGNR